MRVACHIAAVDGQTNQIAVNATPHGWLLPVAFFDTTTSQQLVVLRGMASLPFPAVPRCLALPHIDTSSESLDYTLIVDVLDRGSSGSYSWVSPHNLIPECAIVAYQRRGIELLRAQTAARPSTVEPLWLATVTAWVDKVRERAAVPSLYRVWLHRATAERAVVRFTRDDEVLHFKTETGSVFREAEWTQFIGRRHPSLVAPTLAFDAERLWWLTGHVTGVPLDGSLWPAQLQAIDVWSALQADLISDEAKLLSLGVPHLTRDALLGVADDAISTVARTTPICDITPSDTLARVRLLLDRDICALPPSAVLHLDAASRNILWNGTAPVFLDLDDLYLGPAVVQGELMARRMRTTLSPEQRSTLSTSGAVRALLHLGHPALVSDLSCVPALADLCLLAYRSAGRHAPPMRSVDHDSLLFSWSHVARDFVRRVARWPL